MDDDTMGDKRGRRAARATRTAKDPDVRSKATTHTVSPFTLMLRGISETAPWRSLTSLAVTYLFYQAGIQFPKVTSTIVASVVGLITYNLLPET